MTGIINKPLLLHLVGCLYYLYQWCTVNKISDNEIYLLIKYIKSVLWRTAKRLSYIEEARCLKVKLFYLAATRSECNTQAYTPSWRGTQSAGWTDSDRHVVKGLHRHMHTILRWTSIISAANNNKVTEKLVVNTVLFEEFYSIHGTDGSLTCSQNPASENYPEPHESNLHTITLVSVAETHSDFDVSAHFPHYRWLL